MGVTDGRGERRGPVSLGSRAHSVQKTREGSDPSTPLFPGTNLPKPTELLTCRTIWFTRFCLFAF